MTLVKNGWAALQRYTPARVALGRTGISLPTARHLELQEALAVARDAVHAELNTEALSAEMGACGFVAIACQSAAADRKTYLLHPELGRRLTPASRTLLESRRKGPVDVALVVADGLSARAAQNHAAALLATLRDHLPTAGWSLGPVVIVRHGRVAVGDEVGEVLQARAVAVLIGERPGLSAADSLGVYVTWAPKVGRHDAERNCISNIRAEGLSVAEGAQQLASLLSAARAHQKSGVTLTRLLSSEAPVLRLDGV